MTISKSAIDTDNGKFVIENIILADPQADEVLVKMKAARLCHTDYDSLTWANKLSWDTWDQL